MQRTPRRAPVAAGTSRPRAQRQRRPMRGADAQAGRVRAVDHGLVGGVLPGVAAVIDDAIGGGVMLVAILSYGQVS